MSSLAITAGTAASAQAAAKKVADTAEDDDIEAQAITIGDDIRVKNDRPGRVFKRTSFTSNQVDSVPASTGGTVTSIGDNNWYSINWNLQRNVANGWTPEVDIYDW